MWLGLSVEAQECCGGNVAHTPTKHKMYSTKHLSPKHTFVFIFLWETESSSSHILWWTRCGHPEKLPLFPTSYLWPMFKVVLCCWFHPWSCFHALLINLVFTHILQMIWNKGFIPSFLLVSVSLLSNCLIWNSFLVVLQKPKAVCILR